jgi:toxin ParE1/3/4
MRYKVNLLPEAEDDLVDIYKYVAVNDSFDKAEKLFNDLYHTTLTLQDFPHRGHILHDFPCIDVNYLELSHKPYRIIYQLFGDTVFVLCILDGRRNVQDLLKERVLR